MYEMVGTPSSSTGSYDYSFKLGNAISGITRIVR